MKKLAVVVVLAIVAVSCSSSGSDDGSSTTTTVAVSGASTAPPSDSGSTTTTAVPTPPPAGEGGLDECIVGSWDLESQPFFDQIAASLAGSDAPGDFEHVGGVYRITASPDGTFLDERIDWTFAVRTDDGDMELTINHTQTGTYTVEDGMMTTSIPSGGDAPEVAISIDGVPFNIPGGTIRFDPPAVSLDSAVATCDGDTLTISYEGFTSTWSRSA